MTFVDPLNRRIDYLRVSVTDRCNLACVYCSPRNTVRMLPHHDVLRYEEIYRVVSVAVPLGITHVRITGGEPLLRRGLLPFISSLGRVPGITDISITTNGVLLAEMAEGLRAAGIGRLNISLDTLRPDRFTAITGSDEWQKVWAGIGEAEKCGFTPLKLNMVPVRGVNEDEVAEFARLTLDRDIHVRFIELMPIGSGGPAYGERCVPGGEVREAIERVFGPLAPAGKAVGAGPAQNFRINGGRGIVGFISPMTKHFCSECRRLRLTADGKIRPCLLSDTEIDVRTPLRGGCSDGELERFLRMALEIKPERHYASSWRGGCFERTMSGIGG
jgi:cyclic pyranopterin phosphate synthase